ncbi:MAG: GNAT family N-acetyltransferase [Christensenellales bacterium]|jgi:RimJ/RimL family protein N-acetyltransferase
MGDIYEKYYWQNHKVRLRAMRPEDDDPQRCFIEDLDSQAWAMCHEEMVLPAVKKEVQTSDSKALMNEKAPAFSIENLDGDYVGHIHFNYINERHGTFSIGLIIWREHRGKGYGKAAMEILLDYAFKQRRLNKFNGYCLDENTASANMMLSLGCRQEGTVKEEVFMDGRYHDRLLFGLTAGEYGRRMK